MEKGVADPNTGSEYGIRCLSDPWIRDPGWIKIKIRIRDEHSGSHFRKFRKIFWVKMIKFSDADPDLGSGIFLTLDPGWVKIRDSG
jgi:hypothetical protein